MINSINSLTKTSYHASIVKDSDGIKTVSSFNKTEPSQNVSFNGFIPSKLLPLRNGIIWHLPKVNVAKKLKWMGFNPHLDTMLAIARRTASSKTGSVGITMPFGLTRIVNQIKGFKKVALEKSYGSNIYKLSIYISETKRPIYKDDADFSITGVFGPKHYDFTLSGKNKRIKFNSHKEMHELTPEQFRKAQDIIEESLKEIESWYK